jgi:butyrate kinase
MDKKYKILAINPGSTSTKVSLYENYECLFNETLRHDVAELADFKDIYEQLEYRKDIITKMLNEKGYEYSQIDAVAGRGGFLKPISGGTYHCNDKLCEDLRNPTRHHAANLGGLLARSLEDKYGMLSFIVDPVSVNETQPLGKISGLNGIERFTLFHCLNVKETGRRAAEKSNKEYRDMNFVIAHMGGGISVSAHEKGVTIDATCGLLGEGTFSPERAGTLGQHAMLDLCFESGKVRKEVEKMLLGNGGIVSYLGTNDCRNVEDLINKGNGEAKMVYEAMAYQTSKDISAMASVLKGKVDAICITGGISYSKMLVDWIKERVEFIAPVIVFPGEFEQEALTNGVLEVLMKKREPKTYK